MPQPNSIASHPESETEALQEAINALRERDEFKRRELDAMIQNMQDVQQYVAANREDWNARRGGAELEA